MYLYERTGTTGNLVHTTGGERSSGVNKVLLRTSGGMVYLFNLPQPPYSQITDNVLVYGDYDKNVIYAESTEATTWWQNTTYPDILYSSNYIFFKLFGSGLTSNAWWRINTNTSSFAGQFTNVQSVKVYFYALSNFTLAKGYVSYIDDSGTYLPPNTSFSSPYYYWDYLTTPLIRNLTGGWQNVILGTDIVNSGTGGIDMRVNRIEFYSGTGGTGNMIYKVNLYDLKAYPGVVDINNYPHHIV